MIGASIDDRIRMSKIVSINVLLITYFLDIGFQV